MKIKVYVLALLLLVAPFYSLAAIPNTISYQGRVTDSAGTPLQGSQSLTFSIYYFATGAVALWTEVQTVTVTDGLFSAELGSVTPFGSLVFDVPYFLGISINGGSELSPRKPLTSVPYAMKASDADTVGGLTTTQLQGAVGPQGPIGPEGPAGNDGAVGADGATGPQGDPGVGVSGSADGDMLTWDGTSNIWVAAQPATPTPQDNMQPYLTINYVISLRGIFPSRNALEPFMGEIMMFAGDFAPRDWAFCDGALLSISNYSSLFSLLGTTYGGDGRTTFALPDLRGRVPIHHGQGFGLTNRTQGGSGGVETH